MLIPRIYIYLRKALYKEFAKRWVATSYLLQCQRLETQQSEFFYLYYNFNKWYPMYQIHGRSSSFIDCVSWYYFHDIYFFVPTPHTQPNFKYKTHKNNASSELIMRSYQVLRCFYDSWQINILFTSFQARIQLFRRFKVITD